MLETEKAVAKNDQKKTRANETFSVEKAVRQKANIGSACEANTTYFPGVIKQMVDINVLQTV